MDTEALRLPDELRVVYEAGVEYGRRLAAAEIAGLRAENAELRGRFAELETSVESLRVRAEMNSANSSLPPSSDRPGDRERFKHAKQAGGESGGDDKPEGRRRQSERADKARHEAQARCPEGPQGSLP